MTLPTHQRPPLLLTMTVFAVGMKSLDQTRFGTDILQFMAIRAALILGRFILQAFAVLIDMVAFIAFFDLGQFIMIVMLENSRRALWVFKNRVVNYNHIFLGQGDGRKATKQHN